MVRALYRLNATIDLVRYEDTVRMGLNAKLGGIPGRDTTLENFVFQFESGEMEKFYRPEFRNFDRTRIGQRLMVSGIDLNQIKEHGRNGINYLMVPCSKIELPQVQRAMLNVLINAVTDGKEEIMTTLNAEEKHDYLVPYSFKREVQAGTYNIEGIEIHPKNIGAGEKIRVNVLGEGKHQSKGIV